MFFLWISLAKFWMMYFKGRVYFLLSQYRIKKQIPLTISVLRFFFGSLLLYQSQWSHFFQNYHPMPYAHHTHHYLANAKICYSIYYTRLPHLKLTFYHTLCDFYRTIAIRVISVNLIKLIKCFGCKIFMAIHHNYTCVSEFNHHCSVWILNQFQVLCFSFLSFAECNIFLKNKTKEYFSWVVYFVNFFAFF